MSDEWIPAKDKPTRNGPYLVFMPDREHALDRYSVQFHDRVDGWSGNYGISHWRELPEPPSV